MPYGAPPILDAAIAEAGARWLDHLYPALGPHRVERRRYVSSEWSEHALT